MGRSSFFSFAARLGRSSPTRAATRGDECRKNVYTLAMDPRTLPVYEQRDKILEALTQHSVIVVESPTGSGKTTQIPVILREAGYARGGVIGVTQPRRIAALSVSEFIANQLDTKIPEIVGYKMRFEDHTDRGTEIKIMTDGILLQELKLDPSLSRYSVIMVDEAHERSLNIDFILGLLKRVIEARPEFRVIVSSATLNTEVFSEYFGECPIVKIQTQVFPVTVVYDPPATSGGQSRSEDSDPLQEKIEEIVLRVVGERRSGDILIFLPGEKAIKDCVQRLSACEARRFLHLVPLYARLGKDEQERVFDKAPFGKTKVVISTNIAETSVTIDGITSVIDSGLAKYNHYNPRTYTSSLVETPISKASANQRKGRAGRTRPGSCYRLYARKDFEARELFTREEIFRTDLSEVVLRMAELGISDFESFDFISPPGKEAIRGAIEALNLLDALDGDRELSAVGKLMCAFPLLPRHSRMIVEAMREYPDVIDEVLTAAAFLSTQSPFVLPPGEELEARRAHHQFRDSSGDFLSYLAIFKAFAQAERKDKFCERGYLDERTLREICNVKAQLELIVSDLGFPLGGGGSAEHYLCAVSRGLIQFVCARSAREVYRSLTADRIQIHPGSAMYKENPSFIVAGEVVRTTRTYAMSVSPLRREWIERISPELAKGLLGAGKEGRSGSSEAHASARDFTNQIRVGKSAYQIEKGKDGRKVVCLPWERLSKDLESVNFEALSVYKDLRAKVRYGQYDFLSGEKLELVLRVCRALDPERELKAPWPKKRNFDLGTDANALVECLGSILKLTPSGKKGRELGFVAMFSDSEGRFWFKVSRGFHTALNESLASLEALIDGLDEAIPADTVERVNAVYRKLSNLLGA
jgi:ATP-dependent helicase HrpA